MERGDGRVRADIGGAQQWGVVRAVQPGRPEYRVGEQRPDGASVERGDGRVRADIGGALWLGVVGAVQPAPAPSEMVA